MKICILGDTHIGVRSDSIHFHNYFAKFYGEFLFPYLVDHGITHIIQSGDLFDRRKYISFQTLYLVRHYFFDRLVSNGLRMITYLGNHDLYYRNTLLVNSPELLLQDYIKVGAIDVVVKPETRVFDGLSVDIIPWICQENEAYIKQFINNTKSSICFGHFEIAGFEMEKGLVCLSGIDRKDLNRYNRVVSGHFHHRSTDGRIFYVGAPCEHTWSDYNDKRGFHIFDTETQQLEFIENPYHMFFVLKYDDTVDRYKVSANTTDFSVYKDCYVKVIVENKSDPVLFDQYITRLTEANPADMQIIEDFTQIMNIDDLMCDNVDQSNQTLSILEKSIDNLETPIDKERLRMILRDIYTTASQLEVV